MIQLSRLRNPALISTLTINNSTPKAETLLPPAKTDSFEKQVAPNSVEQRSGIKVTLSTELSKALLKIAESAANAEQGTVATLAKGLFCQDSFKLPLSEVEGAKETFEAVSEIGRRTLQHSKDKKLIITSVATSALGDGIATGKADKQNQYFIFSIVHNLQEFLRQSSFNKFKNSDDKFDGTSHIAVEMSAAEKVLDSTYGICSDTVKFSWGLTPENGGVTITK